MTTISASADGSHFDITFLLPLPIILPSFTIMARNNPPSLLFMPSKDKSMIYDCTYDLNLKILL